MYLSSPFLVRGRRGEELINKKRELEKEWVRLDNLICNSKWRYSEGLIPCQIKSKKVRLLDYGEVTLRRRVYKYRSNCYGEGHRYLLDEYLGFTLRMRVHSEVK